MFDFDEVINRIGTNCVKWDLKDCKKEDIIPMWVADMDFKSPQKIIEAITKRAEHGVYGYSIIDDEYYKIVMDWMKRRYDFNTEKEWIVTTPGVVTALKVAVNAYTNPGDAVIINKPVYYPFDHSIDLNSRKKIENQMIFDGKSYKCDFEAFEKAIIDNNVKMYILCNPYNPIGKVWTKEELSILGNICKKHGVIVVSDEIHSDFIYGNNKHIPFYNVDKSFENFSVICTSPSKSFNLAGLQTSNIFIANPELRDKFKKTSDKCGINAPNFFGIIACKTAYNECEDWLDEMLEYVYGNFKYLDNFLKTNIPEIKLIEPQGLYLAWVDFRGLDMNHEDLEKFMLEKAGLWLDEGYIFGDGGEGFERFNLAIARPSLEEALERLLKAVKTLR